MGITVGQPAVKSANAWSDDDLLDDIGDDEGDGDDGDSVQVEDCEQAINLVNQEIAFNENLQAQEAAQEAAAINLQIARNSTVAVSNNRADQRQLGTNRLTARAVVQGANWLQRDPGQISGTVAMTLMQKVAAIPRSELLTDRPVTVQLGQKTFDVNVQADASGMLSFSCQGQCIGSLPASMGATGGNSRIA
jgi:hypothetical protein